MVFCHDRDPSLLMPYKQILCQVMKKANAAAYDENYVRQKANTAAYGGKYIRR